MLGRFLNKAGEGFLAGAGLIFLIKIGGIFADFTKCPWLLLN
jgi:hypothetical protein